jgi:predicted amidohydrolase
MNQPFKNSMKLCLCQYEIKWQDAEANRQHLDKLFGGLSPNKTDIIVLPEMFQTGFSMDSVNLAETMDGPTIRWMSQWATQLNSAITGSLIIKDQNQYYNRLVWIEPGNSEVTTYYDKKHLFTLADEPKHYSAGTKQLSLSWKDWTISFYICYDLRFPVWTRNTEAVDLQVYIANFPSKRERAWNSLLPARAIENQCYVAAVNRIGLDGNGIEHQGDSAVYDYEGRNLAALGNKEELQLIELSHRNLEVFRRAYPFLNDRDIFKLSNETGS